MRTLLVPLLALAVAACSAPAEDPSSAPSASAPSIPVLAAGETFAVTSTDIAEDGELAGTALSSVFAFCDGPGEAPELAWTPGPAGTETFAVRLENLTTVFDYWMQYDIPATILEIPTGGQNSAPGIRGRNSTAARGYIGPCPEPNETHNYRITVYALDTAIGEQGLSSHDFEAAADGHILAEATLEAWKSGPDEG